MFEAFSEFDFAVLNGIQDIFACSFMNYFMKIVSFLGGAVIWVVVGIIMLFFRKHRICGIYIIAAVALGIIVGELLIKPIFMRERPFLVNDFPIIVDPPSGTSFPSTHTLMSFAAAISLFKFKRWAGLLGVLLAILTGFSRLYLYVHFPTDVIAGAVIGTVVGLIVLLASYLITKLSKKKQKLE